MFGKLVRLWLAEEYDMTAAGMEDDEYRSRARVCLQQASSVSLYFTGSRAARQSQEVACLFDQESVYAKEALQLVRKLLPLNHSRGIIKIQS
jgi:hypothetical protein